MGNGEFLIPANSKKSMLYLSFFTIVDLIIFGSGIGITFILMLIIKSPSLSQIIFVLLPTLIAAFLVMPVPNHHNIRILIKNIYTYFTGRRKYFWKGWCITSVYKDE